jgi:hypothetical protein
MMSGRRVVVLTIGSLGVLAMGALVARAPRAVDVTGDKSGAAPAGAGAAPSKAPQAQVTTPEGTGSALTRGPDTAPPVVLTPRDVAALVSEASLMVRLHQLAETNPPLSLELARQGNARFPHTPAAPERAFIVVKSLVDMGRFKEAQQEARGMLKDYPHDPHTFDVQRHLLSNPLE